MTSYTGVLCPELVQQFWNLTATSPAAPVGSVSYVLYTYLAGTTTPTTTWTDASLGAIGGPNTNPIVLNAAGQANIFLNPSISYKFVYTTSNDTNPPTSPIYTVDNVWPPLSALSGADITLTGAQVGAALWPQSLAEIAAGITPTTLGYPWGAFRRYGADPTGVVASDTAISNACLCNSEVFDDYPGGGEYLFNTGITLTNYPITIRGQAKNNIDTVMNVGTIFLFASAAGASAALLGAAYIDGLNVRNIGFQFQSASAQYAIHIKTAGSVAGQLRSSIIENCAFMGTGAGDTNIGIQIDSGTGGSQYSAFTVIRSNYFSHISAGIEFTGNTTPNQITENTFLGYTGASSVAAGNAIYIASPGAELKVIGNYFEGWVSGIYSNGATNIQQIGNDYQSCTQSFNWVANGSGVINNQSIGETGVAGIYSGQTSLDGSKLQIVGGFGNVATGAAVQSTRGFQEGTGAGTNLRTALLGYHTTPSSPTLTANGGGTISAQNTNTWSYTLVGGSMFLDFNITATLTGSGSSVLSVPIPASLTSIVQCQCACAVTNNGAVVVGTAYIAASATALNFSLIGAGDFTAGTVGASGQIMIRIVS